MLVSLDKEERRYWDLLLQEQAGVGQRASRVDCQLDSFVIPPFPAAVHGCCLFHAHLVWTQATDVQ
jgi:hypothetical protein